VPEQVTDTHDRAPQADMRLDGGATIAGDDDLRAFAGESVDVAHPGDEALTLEAAAGATHQATMTAWLFQPDADPRAVSLAEVRRLASRDANFVWIDLCDYGKDELGRVAEVLGLHPIGVRSALSAWKRPRVDVFDDHFLVTVTLARLDSAAYRVEAREIDLFVGANFLFSAHKQEVPFVERSRVRAGQDPDLVKLDAAYMLYIILDELLEYYEDLNERLQGELELMEERALTDTSARFLEDLIRFKRYAFALGQLAEQHREVFVAFLRPEFRAVSGQTVEVYYRDLHSRLAHLVDVLTAAKDAVNGAFTIYVSHMAHRTNSIMKVLTMVSTVLLPCTLIIALFSTSIQGVFFLTQPYAFALMLTVILLVSGGVLLAYHRNRWI